MAAFALEVFEETGKGVPDFFNGLDVVVKHHDRAISGMVDHIFKALFRSGLPMEIVG